ncbi:hypothetical protein [Candidatus Uabimicrobium sp. HlEnr_7]|uniref:hypothetical protein n=1 Tax=Candidatus Uabimicrobium helgolandensis TaxID=3095367 RepID=UPI003558E425
MKILIFISLALSFVFAEDLYYSVSIGNKDAGYIHARFTELDYKNKPARIIESWSVFNLQGNKYIIDEKTIISKSKNKVAAYLLEYQRNLATEQQQYLFSENSVNILSSSAKPPINIELPLNRGVTVVTNYFSLIPLFAKCEQFPLSFFVVEPQGINPNALSVPSTKMTIVPLGTRNIKILGKRHKTQVFQMVKENASKLTFWLSNDKKKILRVKQHQLNSTIIELNTEDVVYKKPSDALPKIRPFPFKSGQMYRYVTTVAGEKTGIIEFFVHFNEQKKLHEVTAIGNLVASGVSFTSKTQYNENLKPVHYQLQQKDVEGKSTIQANCNFKKSGVKAHFQKGTHIIDRLIPLDVEYVFLDNNSYHHFATFASQLPFSLTNEINVYIFHPRRLQLTKALFSPLKKLKGGTYVYQLKTPFYELKMWVDKEGYMVKYQQGNLVAHLQKKK